MVMTCAVAEQGQLCEGSMQSEASQENQREHFMNVIQLLHMSKTTTKILPFYNALIQST